MDSITIYVIILKGYYLCGDFLHHRRKMQDKRTFFPSFLSIMGVLLVSSPLSAQGAESSNNVTVIAILIIIGALILVSAILTLSQNFISLEAQKIGVDIDDETSDNPITKLWKSPAPSFTKGSTLVELDKGHDILLKGSAAKTIVDAKATRYAVKPQDYRGMSPIPKVLVAVGDEVKAGQPLLIDKKNDRVKHVSPVSGEVIEVKRGEKRSIAEVIILADKEIKYHQYEPPSISEASREDIVEFLLNSGGWTLLNQRPHDIMPSPEDVPANIFISTFDTAPLAPDYSIIIEGREDAFQKGLDTLNRLTTGNVCLGLDANGDKAPHAGYTEATGVNKRWFKGKHPSGNVGIQIHHTAPIKPGMKVWTLGVQEVIALGDLMHKGIFNAEKVVALGGNNVVNPTHIRTYAGANIGELVKENIVGDNFRIVDGDVLSGKQSSLEGFLSAKSDQLSVIEEGDYYEIFGWLLPITPRPTISKTFPNFLYPNMEFEANTNTHGERRAFVVSGQYEKVLPMKIYPQHLMKAIMTGDFEQMEGLGIYELSEEDVALCEFVCTSKVPLQSILRDGLEMIREQS